MSILERFGYKKASDFNAAVEEAMKREIERVYPWLAETADAQSYDFNYSPNPVYANQSDMYRLSHMLGAALDILADDIGLSQGNVKRMVGEELRDIPNHEFEVLMRGPNPLDSGMEFMRDTAITYKLNGNAIWWLNRSSWNDKPLEMWPIPFEMIQPVPDRRLYVSHYDYFPGMGKQPIQLPVWQIVHFKTYNHKNRFVGLSPLESLAMTLQGNLGMQATKMRQYTEYGGAPQSILAFKDWVNNEAWQDIKVEKKNAAMKNEMMMLRGVGDGVTWMSRALSSRDAEFVENLKADMEAVFNRMVPGLLAMLDKSSTEANALAARATYSEKSLWKTLETFAQKITANIMPAYGRKLMFVYDDPRMVDRKLQLEEQAAFERVHTVAEIRKEKYGDEPLGDERDRLLVSEISAASRAVQSDNATPAPDNTERGEDVTGQETGDDDLAVKAALDELQTWRVMALRGKALKAANFRAVYIPSGTVQAVKHQLNSAANKDEIAAIFERAADGLRVKPIGEINGLLYGIEQGIKALEMSAK